MSLLGLDITIIGGGIGGLGAALAMSARGAQVTVLEQSSALREVGAGLQISPNGLRVIEALGLAEALLKLSVRGRAVSLRDHRRGREVARLDLTRLPTDQTYLFTHRADLIAVLAQEAEARGANIRLNTKVVDVEPAARPRLTLRGGATLDTGLLIGADGLRSILRPVLNGVVPAKFTGQVAWRAVIDNEVKQRAEVRVYMGPGRHLVCYPLRDGKSLNIVAVQERKAWADEGWHVRDDPANLRAAFKGAGDHVAQRLDAIEEVHLWGLFRHEVAANWYGEGCALLGDAAHPTLPFLAQGANMALEDAWCLAEALASHDSRAAAFVAYKAARRPRCTRIVAAADANAWKYHLRPGPFRFAAHTGLKLASHFAPGLMMKQFDWLYGYDVTRDR